MNSQTAELCLGKWNGRKLVVTEYPGQLTSDAGLLTVARFDRQVRFTERFAGCLREWRKEPAHSLLEMVRQRVLGIIAGYEDANDHDQLRTDPVFKLIAERLPEDAALASQPTLSRFENHVTPADLMALIRLQIQTGIERLKAQHGGALPQVVTLEIDTTDDPTHGQQQLSLFHGYYGQYQYSPLLITEPTTRHVFLAWLRFGTAHASLGADEDLQMVVDALRAERSDIEIHLRGDCGFGIPRMYDACETQKTQPIRYLLGLSTNVRLKEIAQPLLDQAVQQFDQTGEKQRLFMTFEYQAESWPHARQVIAKAECHAPGINLRFVVTNHPCATAADAERLYDDYIQRGAAEHQIDELKNGLAMDRLSCHRFLANFFRLLLHVAAYNLFNAFRDHDSFPPELKAAQPAKWRSQLIKVAALVSQSTRRVLVSLSGHWPNWPTFRQAAALPGFAPTG